MEFTYKIQMKFIILLLIFIQTLHLYAKYAHF